MGPLKPALAGILVAFVAFVGPFILFGILMVAGIDVPDSITTAVNYLILAAVVLGFITSCLSLLVFFYRVLRS